MAILAHGINYRTAPIDLRERVAFPEDALGRALRDLLDTVPEVTEAAIISTCNRTELYCRINGEDENAVHNWLCTYQNVNPAVIAGVTYTHWDQDAARHLINVAAGLDSQVLGEPQIMGQVKAAFELARNMGTLGPELNLLCQVTLNTAKRIRTDTDIGRNPVSVAYAAVTMAKQIFTDLGQKKALLLGAGDTIALVAEHLSEQRVGGIAIANRTLTNAETLATRFGAEPMQLTDVSSRLHEFDMVIASTGSSLPVVGKGAVEAAIKQRRHRPIFMVDIAVPRDIEPEVAELKDVFLFSIDDLTEIIEENLKNRLNAADRAEALVDEGAVYYIRERRAHHSQAMLRRFRDNAQAVQAAELAKALKDLQTGRDPEAVLTSLSASLTNKLIHAPTVAIRTASADGRTDILETLKNLYQLD
jgi:glutamyl-tRNA reductase